jgi:hypothetical protein
MIAPEAFNDIHAHMMTSADDHGVILGHFRDGCN